MAQIFSVSAHTAAYAAEGMKPISRTPKKTEVEQAIHELARKAEQSSDLQLKALMTVIKPPALSLYFLTSERNRNPQLTLEQAIEAYRANQTAIKTED